MCYIVLWIVCGIVFFGFLFFFVVILINFVFWNEKLIVIIVSNMVVSLFGKSLLLFIKLEKRGVVFFLLYDINFNNVLLLSIINVRIVIILILEN